MFGWRFCSGDGVEREPGGKAECVPKFCYLGDTLGSGGGVEEAARARVRCAWAKFKELPAILTARGASYHMKRKIHRACVQSVWHIRLRPGQWRLRILNILLRSKCPNHLYLPGFTTSATHWIPRSLHKSSLRFLFFKNTPHIHLTINRSVLSRLSRFSAFIAQFSVP